MSDAAIAATLENVSGGLTAKETHTNLIFKTAAHWTPPAASNVVLDFNPPPPQAYTPSIGATLADVSGVAVAKANPSAHIAAQLDSVSGQFFSPTFHFASIAATLQDAGGHELLIPTPPIYIQPTLDDVSGSASASFLAGVFRGIESSRLAPFATDTVAQQLRTNVGEIMVHPAQKYWQQVQVWKESPQLQNFVFANWANPPQVGAARSGTWGESPQVSQLSLSPHTSAPQKPLESGCAWAQPAEVKLNRSSEYISPSRRDLFSTGKFILPTQAARSGLFPFEVARHVKGGNHPLVWDDGNPHSWVWGGYPQPPGPVVPPWVPSTTLRFYQNMLDYTGGAILQFGYPCYAWPIHGGAINPPIVSPGVTIVLHTLSVTRISDGADVPVTSVRLRFDRNSWAWTVELALKGEAAMALISPIAGEPVQVRVNLDGILISAIIDSFGDDRRFASRTYTASGKSILGLMAEPFAPKRSWTSTLDMTAAQLIDRELLNTGWSVSYHSSLAQLFTTDWLVPAGVWSYQNLTPVEAITAIAKSVGARAFADKNNPIVHIEPTYPINPWDWATAQVDASIPLFLPRIIGTQLNRQPNYNHVYVSGENQGVLVSAVRMGTAGDVPAPMITDPLITFVNAGREAARNILCNVGKQANISMEMPLNTTTGLLEPGKLVEVWDASPWRGLVSALEVSGTHANVSQQVTIERHYS